MNANLYEASINAFPVAFGIAWLPISITLLYNILRILKRHGLLTSLFTGVRGLDEENVIPFVKDVISLYRGYRWYIVVTAALSCSCRSSVHSIISSLVRCWS